MITAVRSGQRHVERFPRCIERRRRRQRGGRRIDSRMGRGCAAGAELRSRPRLATSQSPAVSGDAGDVGGDGGGQGNAGRDIARNHFADRAGRDCIVGGLAVPRNCDRSRWRGSACSGWSMRAPHASAMSAAGRNLEPAFAAALGRLVWRLPTTARRPTSRVQPCCRGHNRRRRSRGACKSRSHLVRARHF